MDVNLNNLILGGVSVGGVGIPRAGIPCLDGPPSLLLPLQS